MGRNSRQRRAAPGGCDTRPAGFFRTRGLQATCAGLLLLAGCSDPYRTPDHVVSSAALVVAEQNLLLGEVWASTAVEHALHIRNTSERDVRIARFDATCNCTSVAPESVTIPAGEATDVLVTVDLLKGPSPATDHRLSVRLMPRIAGDESTRISWMLRGYVKQLLKCEPPCARFDELTRGHPFDAKVIAVHSACPLASLVARCDESVAAVATERVSDQEHRVSVVPRSELPPGPFEGTIVLLATPPDSPPLETAHIVFFGRVEEEVEADPHELHLGAGRVGETLGGTVTLRSRVNEPFQVESVRDHAALTADWDRRSGHDIEVRIAHIVRATGPQSETLTMVVRSAGDAPLTILLPVAWHGLAEGSEGKE
ncbi:MAG: DUF1573 domain-containing protein [Planctomycetia bacterium]|nr:DUF1573 domain-containing protein [Planctomycetia bacterium]